jgi:hypothetical protein
MYYLRFWIVLRCLTCMLNVILYYMLMLLMLNGMMLNVLNLYANMLNVHRRCIPMLKRLC